MVKKLLARVFVVIASIVATVFLSAGLALLMRWINKPSATSAEGLLLHADELAWNNNWLAATPVYAKAEEAFNRKGDQGHALYAHVSQFAFRMENSDLSSLIAELNHDLPLPSSSAPDVRLRVLEMKAKCEEEYDAGIAIKTFAEVERIALSQNKYYLASRASVPVRLKVELRFKGERKSGRRTYLERDDEDRTTELERRGKDKSAAPAFD